MSACEHEWTMATPLEVCARCSVVRYGPEHARELETLLDAARVELDENVGVIRVLRRHRTEAADSLRQAVEGLPKCEFHVKYRDAMGGEETCRHVAMQSQRRPLLARAEFVCRIMPVVAV
jgi:hypothetical protein